MQSLEDGQSLVLIHLLTTIIILHAVACVLMIYSKRLQSGLLRALVDCTYVVCTLVGCQLTWSSWLMLD